MTQSLAELMPGVPGRRGPMEEQDLRERLDLRAVHAEAEDSLGDGVPLGRECGGEGEGDEGEEYTMRGITDAR